MKEPEMMVGDTVMITPDNTVVCDAFRGMPATLLEIKEPEVGEWELVLGIKRESRTIVQYSSAKEGVVSMLTYEIFRDYWNREAA